VRRSLPQLLPLLLCLPACGFTVQGAAVDLVLDDDVLHLQVGARNSDLCAGLTRAWDETLAAWDTWGGSGDDDACVAFQSAWADAWSPLQCPLQNGACHKHAIFVGSLILDADPDSERPELDSWSTLTTGEFSIDDVAAEVFVNRPQEGDPWDVVRAAPGCLTDEEEAEFALALNSTEATSGTITVSAPRAARWAWKVGFDLDLDDTAQSLEGGYRANTCTITLAGIDAATILERSSIFLPWRR
jgi:hypothetical protein